MAVNFGGHIRKWRQRGEERNKREKGDLGIFFFFFGESGDGVGIAIQCRLTFVFHLVSLIQSKPS